MPKKLTHAEYVARLEGRPIEVLGEYEGSQVRILHRCTVPGCDHEWFALPTNILSGKGCHFCGIKLRIKTRTLSVDKYKRQIAEKSFSLLGEYKNTNTKVDHKCFVCGCVWSASPSNILRGRGCPKCADHGFNPGKPASLYLLLSDDQKHVKIGITNKAGQRHKQLTKNTPFSWHLLHQIEDAGIEIQALETGYHSIFEQYRVKFPEKFDGSTEWFRFEGAVKAILERMIANTKKAA